MTKGEAIDLCMEVRDYLTSGNPMWDKEEVGEALDMAIEALQKPPISQRSMYQAGYRQAQEDRSSGDLISRAEAIEAIELVDWYHQNRNKDMVHGANDDEHQAWYKADDVYKALEAVPSADRLRGYWKHNTTYKSLVFCSECDMPYEAGMTPRNFCPNCGADMRGDTK